MSKHNHNRATIGNRSNRLLFPPFSIHAGRLASIASAFKPDITEYVRMSPVERLTFPDGRLMRYSEAGVASQVGDSSHLEKIKDAFVCSPNKRAYVLADSSFSSGFNKVIAESNDGKRMVSQLIVAGMTITAIVLGIDQENYIESVYGLVLPLGPYRYKPMGGQYETAHTIVASADLNRPTSRAIIGTNIQGLVDPNLQEAQCEIVIDYHQGLTVTGLDPKAETYVIDADTFSIDPGYYIGDPGAKQVRKLTDYLYYNQDAWDPKLAGLVSND